MSRDQSSGLPISEACGAIAFGVPVLVLANRLAAGGLWHDDLQLVRGLGMVPFDAQGGISQVLIQLSSLVPIGGRLLRAGFVSALVLGLVGVLCYRLALRVLTRATPAPLLNTLLAVSAALAATLDPALQSRAAVLEPERIATALALGGLLLCERDLRDDARQWLAFGSLIALTTSESVGIGAVLALALALRAVTLGRLPTRRALLLGGVGFVAVLGVCIAVALVRTRAAGAWLTLGLGVAAGNTASLQVNVPAVMAWLRDPGVLALGLGLVGAVFAVWKRHLRPIAIPLLLLMLLDTALSSHDPGRANTRLLALCGLSIMAALGVQVGVGLFRQLRLPFSEPVSVLLVVFHTTLACSAIEQSVPSDPSTGMARAAFTEAAFGRLPPRSLLLVRDPSLAWQAWAARVERGERPDLVVVPVSLLGHKELASSLLAVEPSLAPLIRDIRMNGVASEYALSVLADTRPLFVELDPRWSARLMEHLTPAMLWLRFAAHPLGRSDRERAVKQMRPAVKRVLRSLAREEINSADTTRLVFARKLREQSTLLAALGDRASLALMLGDLERASPRDPFGIELKQRAAKEERGRIDVTGLLN